MPNQNFASTLVSIITDNINQSVESIYLRELIDYLISMKLPSDHFSNNLEAQDILNLLIAKKYVSLIDYYIEQFSDHPDLLHNPIAGHTALWSAEPGLNLAVNLNKHNREYLKKAFAQVDENGKRILHQKIYNLTVIEELLKNIGDLDDPTLALDALDMDWNTPLHKALLKKCSRSAIALIRAGARIDILNKKNQSALQLLIDISREESRERKDYKDLTKAELDRLPQTLSIVFNGITNENRVVFITELYKLHRRYYDDEHLTEQYFKLLSIFSLKQFNLEKIIMREWNSKVKRRPTVGNVIHAKYGNRLEIGEPEPEDKLTTLQFSENQFDQAKTEIDRNYQALMRYPRNNIGLRILALTLSFLALCINVIVPYILFDQANRRGFYKDIYTDNGDGFFAGGLVTAIILACVNIFGLILGLSSVWERAHRFNTNDVRIITLIIDKIVEHVRAIDPTHASLQQFATKKASITSRPNLGAAYTISDEIKKEIDVVKKDFFLKQHSVFKKSESHVIEIPDPPRLG